VACRDRLVFPLLLFFLLAILNPPVQPETVAETQSYSRAIASFEKFVREQMALDRVPGLSAGFIKDDFLWTQGFGYADLENKVPARPQSSYRMASITKTFTAVAVLQLVEAGKINLDAEIQTYVPYFPQKKWPITVRQLLGHLGGISHYKNRDKESHIKVHKNTKEALVIFQDFDLVAQPGTRYIYSSYGYNLLGAAVEEVSGQPYGSYIKEHIFDPLKMTDSRMDDPVAIIPNRVRGYRLLDDSVVNSEYVNISSRFAAGGTRSTVVDLLKYAKGIIDGRLIKKDSWQQMLEPMATRDGHLTGKGMCWTIIPWRGHFQMSHGGSQPETRTYLVIFPLERFAVAVASNLESFDRTRYMRRLAECVLAEDLDTPVYISDQRQQPLYEACEHVFSCGLSYYDWHNRPLTLDKEDLRKSFFYFNKYVNPLALRRNNNAAKKRIQAGVHPISGQAFTKIGSFMASELEKAFGKNRLRNYHKTGPIPFHRDYHELSKKWPSSKNHLRFTQRFAQQLSQWERDWEQAYTEDIRLLYIFFDTDISQLLSKLRSAFHKASLYPDFHEDLINAAQYHLKKHDQRKAYDLLNLGVELYPNRTKALVSLAVYYLWTGSPKKAEALFKQSYRQNPRNAGISVRRMAEIGSQLINAGKLDELDAFTKIVAGIYPRSWGFLRDIGNKLLQAGYKEKALRFYKNALEINPKLDEVLKKLRSLEKDKGQ
jgi:CubicO group peptidase (beta-lactamase class C family)